jgi:hypothetical protein
LATLESLRDQIKEEILRDPKFLTLLALERSIFDVRSALAGAAAPPPPRIAPPAELASLVDDHLARHAGAAVGASGLGVIGPQIDGATGNAALPLSQDLHGHAPDETPAGLTAVSAGDQPVAADLTDHQTPAAVSAPHVEMIEATAGAAEGDASDIAKEDPDAAIVDVTAAPSAFPDATASAAEAAFAGAIVGTMGRSAAIDLMDEVAAAAEPAADLLHAEEPAVAASLAAEEAATEVPAGVAQSDAPDATASVAPEAALSEAIVDTTRDELATRVVEALPSAEELDTAAPPAPEEEMVEAPAGVVEEPAVATGADAIADLARAEDSVAATPSAPEAMAEAPAGVVEEPAVATGADAIADLAPGEDSVSITPSAPEEAIAEALASVADGEPAIIVVEEPAAPAASSHIEDSTIAGSTAEALASIADGEPAIIVVEAPAAAAATAAASLVAEASTTAASPAPLEEAVVQALASIADGEPAIIVVEEPVATAEPTAAPPVTVAPEVTVLLAAEEAMAEVPAVFQAANRRLLRPRPLEPVPT